MKKAETVKIVAIINRGGPGLKYRPEIIPAQNGRHILRKGISLCSTKYSV
jgi:hypothetical protein